MTEGRSHRLGDVLREAREAKGVDLARVERETKIRERYLAALESGDYAELPGAVYTKGFLRNYGAYLGLDAEYLIDLYRIETNAGAERPRQLAPPRPLTARHARAFVITPGAIVAALLTIGVGAFIAYLAFEIINFARTPDLRITSPPGNVTGYLDSEITIRGETVPNATVRLIRTDDLPSNPTVLADADGAFEVTVELVPGSNLVRLVAEDPVTGRSSVPVERTIIVAGDVPASPTPGAPALALAEPEADATFSGPVRVAGTAAPGAEVTVSVELTEPPAATFRITDAAGAELDVEPEPPATPDAQTLTADGGGGFGTDVSLGPGTWRLRIGAGEAVEERNVTVVAGEGLRGTLRVDGGDSYLEVELDGEAVAGVSGGISSDGDTVDLEADQQIRVLAGNAAAVRITINGLRLPPMGDDGAVIEWRIERVGD